MQGFPTIVHLDADAFFVSCEQARDPSLVGKKCAVGGRELDIISSASYEARACGVYTPMPTARALRVCPDLILIRHTQGLYGDVSLRMFDMCEALTPAVQRNSIDEGYLDLGPCGFPGLESLERAVRDLQRRIWDELRIPVSMGIAANKLVAQIASKLRKPRGFVVVPSGGEEAFLAPLPIGRLPGVGTKTEAALNRLGLRLVRDLFERSERELASLIELDGLPLERHYRNTLENLGKEPGILGIIFRKAQNKIQNPAHLRRLIVDLIDKEPWSALSADVKGDIYEGLLEKNAQDTKSGAGQYFTPRVLIDAIVQVMRPQPGTAIIDPAAGTGGFLLSASSTSSRTTSSIVTRYATCKRKRFTPSNSSRQRLASAS